MSRIDEIKARLAAATPGPWRWRGNTAAKQIDLQTVDRGGIYVMSFRRWGLQSAMPYFQSVPAGLIEPAMTFAVRPQPHNAWFIDGFDHPDAKLIEHAPADIEFLLREIERLTQVTADYDRINRDLHRELEGCGESEP